MQELIGKLKLVDDKLDAEGFNSEGPARKTIAEVSLFLQQLLNKTACSTPLELLQQMYNEEQKAYTDAGTDFLEYSKREYNVECIGQVIRLIKERPPMA